MNPTAPPRRPGQPGKKAGPTAGPKSIPVDVVQGSAFRDGFGEREVSFDPDGRPVELLRLLPEFDAVAAPLSDRIARLRNFHGSAVARALRLERDDRTGLLTLVSERVPGLRLSDLLHRAVERAVVPNVAATLFVIRRLLATAESLHAVTGVAYAAVAPERIALTPRADIIIVEPALAGAIEALAATSHEARTDIAGIALVGISMLLGRTIDPDDAVEARSGLVKEAAAAAGLLAGETFAHTFRRWLHRAIIVEPYGPFRSFREAEVALEHIKPPKRSACRVSRRKLKAFLGDLAFEALSRPETAALEADRIHALRGAQVARRSAPAGSSIASPEADTAELWAPVGEDDIAQAHEAEAARVREEEEARVREEEAARIREEEEARAREEQAARLREEEAARAREEEAARIREEEAARVREEEAARIREEEEARAREEEAARLREEEEARVREEEAARIREEEEARAREEEAARLREEEEARVREEEAARIREEEEARAREEEAARVREEEAARAREEEAARIREEEAARAREEEAARIREEEAARAREEEAARIREEEAARLREEEEARVREEEAARVREEEAARIREEEAARLREEEEARVREEEAARVREEEAARIREEEAARAREEEAARIREEEAARAREEEAARIREEEAARAREEEAARIREEEAARAREEEAARIREEEAARAREEEAARIREEEAARAREEEAARIREEEAARAREEEAARIREEEEARAREEEAARIREEEAARAREEEAARIREEEAARAREEEAARIREEEAARAREEEAARIREEEAARAREEEAARIREEEAARAREEEAARIREEEAARAREEEAARIREEKAARAREEEAARVREEEAARARKAEAKAARVREEEAARAREEEATRARKAEAARVREEEAARKREEEAARVREKEAARAREKEAARARKAEATRVREEEAAQKAEAVRVRDAEAVRARDEKAARAREEEITARVRNEEAAQTRDERAARARDEDFVDGLRADLVAEAPAYPPADTLPTVAQPRVAVSARLLTQAVAAVVCVGVLAGLVIAGRSYYTSATASGTVTVESRPAGVEILLDGKVRGVAPLTMSMKPGTHSLELRRGGATRQFTLEVSPGARMSQHVDWTNTKPVGTLTITSTPTGAKVSVDGKSRGVTPLTMADLPAGPHKVVLESSKGTVQRDVKVEAGSEIKLNEAIYPGWIGVFAPFDLQIYEGKHLLGTTETARILVPPGHHELQLVNERLGYRETHVLDVNPGETAAVNVAAVLGIVRVRAPAGAEVSIDGERVGETPLGDLQVPIGTREIVVKHPQLGEQRVTTTVKRSAPAEVNVDFSKRR